MMSIWRHICPPNRQSRSYPEKVYGYRLIDMIYDIIVFYTKNPNNLGHLCFMHNLLEIIPYLKESFGSRSLGFQLQWKQRK